MTVMMRAVVMRGYRRAALEVVRVPAPRLRPGDIRVAVHAAGVNPVDLLVRAGRLRLVQPYPMPLVLGSEVSGTVLEVGPRARGFRVGDEVFARLEKDRLGGFAEQVTLDAKVAAHKPASLTHQEAAAVPLAGLTAWQALTEVAQLRTGQSVLVHGAAGGVGSLAVQLARHLGAGIIAVTARRADHPLLKDLGANIFVDYRRHRFEEHLGGIDLVLEVRGGQVTRRSMAVLRRGGTVVTVAGPPTPQSLRGSTPRPGVRLLLAAVHLRNRGAARRHGVGYRYLYMRPDGAQLAHLADLVDKGELRPRVGPVYPLTRADEALDRVRRGGTAGKVVIAPQAIAESASPL